jgi:UDPglucose 6-dehydrogenase
VDIVYSPENLRLGEAIRCYLHPDRIVLGAEVDAVSRRVRALFAPMNAPVMTMSLASAEMTKHALNGFLATSISFVNEIADLCEATGADILSVVGALKADARIGPNAFLSSGFGFAGGTLARDIQVLREVGRSRKLDTPLLDSVLRVNHGRLGVVLRRLAARYGSVNGLDIGVLGLTYKAGTSTLRRSVALEVIRTLAEAGAHVRAFDPKADLAELEGQKDFEAVGSPEEAARGASALIVLTEWPEFKTLDFDQIRSLMKEPVILDGKNLLADLQLGERGFHYMGIGR